MAAFRAKGEERVRIWEHRHAQPRQHRSQREPCSPCWVAGAGSLRPCLTTCVPRFPPPCHSPGARCARSEGQVRRSCPRLHPMQGQVGAHLAVRRQGPLAFESAPGTWLKEAQGAPPSLLLPPVLVLRPPSCMHSVARPHRAPTPSPQLSSEVCFATRHNQAHYLGPFPCRLFIC